ncbi:MAG: anthranilate synthase component I [Acidimicrobiaceae bacterium]|nr:anthranilate synthase component I [Acidimicrobiaceae bacterium]
MEPTPSDVIALFDQGYTVVPLHRTLQLDRDTPVSLYQRLAPHSAFCLLESAALGEGTGRYSFIGLDRLWRVTSTGSRTEVAGASVPSGLGPLEAVRVLLARYRVAPSPQLPFVGGAIGFVTYDYVRRLEHLPADPGDDPWPDADFSFPGAVLICDHLRHSTTVVVLAISDDETDPSDALETAQKRLSEIEETLLTPAEVDPQLERLVAYAPQHRDGVPIREIAASYSDFTAQSYSAVVERAREYIYAGDIFQVVPSQQFRRPSRVNPLTLYRVLRSLNPSPYMYLLDTGDAQLVGASPEMLVNVTDGLVTTRPIAGTRRRGASEAEDRALEAEMLADDKEIAEHVMLVDLGRNDIGRVSTPGSVTVTSLAHVERFSHLMHLVSEVSGTLAEGLDAIDAFNALFPAGTLSGAPKVRAMEIIDEFEPVRRGPYGGAVGYFSLNGGCDFAITIRTVGLRHGVATVQAGGGVVADSTGLFEYHECLTKASAPLLALELADPS